MPIKTPKFWYKSADFRAFCLLPLAALYQLGHQINTAIKRPYKSSLPVICVGNIVMGGSGKTPTVLALIDLIKHNQIAKNPVILTRGYGGAVRQPIIVDAQKHTYHDVGDEALLLTQKATVIVSPDRKKGAQKAETMGADLIIMDDGFQNNSLHKDINLLVVDGHNPFGNGFLFPAGPLREPLSCALKRCDAVISIAKELTLDKTQFNASIRPDNNQLDKTQAYIAFAGLGRPEKFKQTLEQQGYNVCEWFPFADHHPYSEQDLEELEAHATHYNAALLTTEKDYVRLPAPYQKITQVLPISLSFHESEAIVTFLKERLLAC